MLAVFGLMVADATGQSPKPPVLISETTSTRAIAIDSVTFAKEPFSVSSLFAADGRTRVTLFALNLSLLPNESLTAITADAETATHQVHSLQVEYAGTVPSLPWLNAVVLRLNDNLTIPGDVLVSVTFHGVRSNRVRIGIGSVGGGPPDDGGATPTPAPPYLISGHITAEGQPLAGINLILSGDQSGAFTTDATGFYSILVNAFGNYTLSSGNQIFDLSPAVKTFTNLRNNAPNTNLTAVRRLYNIVGTVKSATNDPMGNVPVALGGFQTSSSTTDSSGHFAFNDLPAGRNYTVNVPATAFFSFSPQQTSVSLAANANTDFVGTLRKYNIAGNVKIGTAPLANGVVRLGGAQTATTTTDTNGNFVFTDVNAQANYQVAPDPTPLKSFVTKSITTLNSDQFLSFTDVPRKYAITGTVSDGNSGVTGVRIRLAGSETATLRTNAAGQYSFNVTVLGDYTVTPDIEQQYFSFSPAATSINALVGDKTLNFDATLQPILNPAKVLEFDGTPKTVDYGNFWPAFTDLGHFFWEFWAMPGPNAGATYMLSDGYGGLHALLFGFANFNTSETNRYQLLGNMNDGLSGADHIFYFNSDQGPAVGEWGHFAVGWDGRNVITYLNGVPVGKTAYARPRQSTGPGNGAGRLLIGGSDHSNFSGRIAQVRGFEGTNPRENTSVESSFVPQTVFAPDGNLLSWYFTPDTRVADLSRGYLTGSHPGVPRGTTAGILFDCGACPPPQFVLDPTAPNFVTNTPGQLAEIPVAPVTPPAALVFDSFSRTNSTYTLGAKGGLGSTEAGSTGAQPWVMDQDQDQHKPFGILNGLGVILADAAAVSWVNTGSTSGNLDVRVDRKTGNRGSGVSTGISFRVRDYSSYFFAFTSTNGSLPGPQTLTVGYYLDGFKTTLVSGASIPQPFTTLRVVTKATGIIQVFVDSALVYSTTQLVLSRETKAGLYSDARGMGLVNRWDNFRVFEADP